MCLRQHRSTANGAIQHVCSALAGTTEAYGWDRLRTGSMQAGCCSRLQRRSERNKSTQAHQEHFIFGELSKRISKVSMLFCLFIKSTGALHYAALRRPGRVWEVQQYPPLGVWAACWNSLKTSLSSLRLLPDHIQPLAFSRTQLTLRNILAECNNKCCICPTHACLLQTTWVAFFHPYFPFSTWLTKNCICSHK